MTKPNATPRSSMRTVQFCKRCGKPLGNQGVSSLTGWLFQETFCQCQLQDSASKGKRSDSQPGSLFGDTPGDKDVFDLPSFGDEYEVLERIGRGGMGCVYKVRDVNLDRFLAVKVMHDQLKSDQQSISRFEREAKAALKLMHANLVPVFAFGSSPSGAPYLVMDFVDGISLETKLKNESYLDVSIAIDIFYQICGALTHAHQHGIIHRDLKPGNIIITKDESGKGIAKLVDFGIAKVRSGSNRETQNLTQTGEVFGSPHYMSPEQCLGFELDSRSDIYSLGCVMYECLSGKTPFEGHNAVQLVAKHLSSDVPPLRICDTSQSQRINNRLIEIISKCLEKEPGDRYFSAELLAIDLKQLTEEVSSSTVSIALPRKLSILRSLFLIFSSASLLSISFVIIPDNKAYLVILPAVAAMIGAALVNGRLNDFVSRTQFQSKLIRESAGSCVNVLIVCHWILATCVISALMSPFLHMTPVAYPVCSAALGTVVIVAVWSGFMQSVETCDIKGSIQSGRIMNAISISMLATTVLFVSQYYGHTSSTSTLTPASVSVSVPSSMDLRTMPQEAIKPVESPNQIYSEISKEVDDALLSDGPVKRTVRPNYLASVIQHGGKKYRQFKLVSNVNLGHFYPITSMNLPTYRAMGTVELPLSAMYGLSIRPEMTLNYASLLAKFPPDSLFGLTIEALMYPGARIDDAMYFARNWKSLVELNISGGDLSDTGLGFVRSFKYLRYLSLSDTNVTAAGVSSLPQLRQLSGLSISNISNSNKIIEALRRSSKLRSLVLSHVKVDANALKEIGRFPHLEHLSLHYVDGISENGIKELCANKSLLELGFTGSKVTAKYFPYLAKLTSLRTLDLGAESANIEERRVLQRALPNCIIRVHTTAN